MLAIDVSYAGICGSDINNLKANYSSEVPVMSWGHEIVGRISGSRSTSYFIINPYICHCSSKRCKQSSVYYCDSSMRLGIDNGYGGFCGRVFVPVRNIYEMTESKFPESGIFADSCAVIIHALHISKIQKGRILIIGDGTIGALSALYIGQLYTDLEIDIIVRKEKKKAILERILPPNLKLVSEKDIRSLYYDLVIEAVGGSQTDTLRMATEALNYSGTLLVLGAFSAATSEWIGLRNVFYKQIRVLGVNSFCVANNDFEQAVNWVIQNEKPLAGLITDKYQIVPTHCDTNYIREKIAAPKLIKGCFCYE